MSHTKKIKSYVKNGFLHVLLKSGLPGVRRRFWDLSAKHIHKMYGDGTGDFEVVEQVISRVGPQRLLDVGCGSGRLFPVYKKSAVREIYAQDISGNAIDLCRRLHHDMQVHYVCREVVDLPYSGHYFDLVISNRVLGAIPSEKIDRALKKICFLGKYVYLNEMTQRDYTGPSSYWFLHDYHSMMTANEYCVVTSGLLGRQEWYLYGRK